MNPAHVLYRTSYPPSFGAVFRAAVVSPLVALSTSTPCKIHLGSPPQFRTFLIQAKCIYIVPKNNVNSDCSIVGHRAYDYATCNIFVVLHDHHHWTCTVSSSVQCYVCDTLDPKLSADQLQLLMKHFDSQYITT